MYTLLPWRLLSTLLCMIIAVAIYIDDLFALIGITVPDIMVVRFLPVVLISLFMGFFAPTCYWAPWRIMWRIVPRLNAWFPDLNGIWAGTTSSNWPTIKMLVDTAKSTKQVTENELHNTPSQNDALVALVKNNLFHVRIIAKLGSTHSDSHTISATPWRHQHTKQIHISYIYQQSTPNPESTDEETHLGAADLMLVNDGFSTAEGVYWTRRAWRTGRNTAGKISLQRRQSRKNNVKSLDEYAAEHFQTST